MPVLNHNHPAGRHTDVFAGTHQMLRDDVQSVSVSLPDLLEFRGHVFGRPESDDIDVGLRLAEMGHEQLDEFPPRLAIVRFVGVDEQRHDRRGGGADYAGSGTTIPYHAVSGQQQTPPSLISETANSWTARQRSAMAAAWRSVGRAPP